MCRTLGGGVALYDYEWLLRIVSLLVSQNWKQKLINAFVPEQQSPAWVFVLCGLYMYMYMYSYSTLIKQWVVMVMIVMVQLTNVPLTIYQAETSMT